MCYVCIATTAFLFEALGIFIGGMWSEVGVREEIEKRKWPAATFSVDLNGWR